MFFAQIPLAFMSVAIFTTRSISCGFGPEAATQLDIRSLAASNHLARAKRQSNYTLKKIALENVRVFDGTHVQAPSTVIIDGSVIGSDPTGAEHIDGQGGVLLPGLIDTHCHPTNITDMKNLAKWGVTTGFTMSCFAPEMCTSLMNLPGLPNLLMASAPASAAGSGHGNITVRLDTSLILNSTSEIPAWMARQLAPNPDYIKLVAESPGFDQQALNALVEAAHKGGKYTVTHAAAQLSFTQSILAHSKHIHHAPLDDVLPSYMIQTMLRNHQIATPTLTMMRNSALNSPSKYNFTPALETVRKLHVAGIPILAGTDANMQTGVPAQVEFGSSMHDELENLIEAGMCNAEALRAATLLPAIHFGLEDRGAIEEGMRADLMLIEGDPLEDIKATRNIKRVWIGGVEISGL